MIKFFRKIRYNLMEQNKTGKYLKYAIGEIILVVIGILIALQINNWNENRKQSKQAFEYLSEFKKDLESDTLQFNFMVKLLSRNLTSGVNLLKKTKSTSEDINDIRVIIKASVYQRDINQKTFQKIQNAGNSNLRGFEDLYDRLSNYYIETNRDLILSKEYDESNYTKNRTLFDDFIRKNNLEAGFLREDLIKELKIDSIPYLSKNQKKWYLFDFINSIDGRNYMRTALNRHHYMRSKYRLYTEEASALLNDINKVIKAND
jgi:hypothetical protein